MGLITSKYVYFVSYAWSDNITKESGHGNIDIGLDTKINSMEQLNKISGLVKKIPSNIDKNILILNYILLRKQ